ncbi:MAG: hypothetical protein WCA97_02340 [Terriglobales bacterium]
MFAKHVEIIKPFLPDVLRHGLEQSSLRWISPSHLRQYPSGKSKLHRRHHCRRSLVTVAVPDCPAGMTLLGLILLLACGGGSSSNPPPITATVTVTATSGTLQNTAIILLLLN